MQLTSCIWWRLYSICKTTQEVVSDTIIYVLQEETKDPVTAMWLICCLNCYQFSWPSCFFCYYKSTVFKSSLEPAFCDSGETWETKAFLQRGRWSTWQGGAVWFRESPKGSNLVTEKLRKIKCVTKVCIIRK